MGPFELSSRLHTPRIVRVTTLVLQYPLLAEKLVQAAGPAAPVLTPALRPMTSPTTTLFRSSVIKIFVTRMGKNHRDCGRRDPTASQGIYTGTAPATMSGYRKRDGCRHRVPLPAWGSRMRHKAPSGGCPSRDVRLAENK